jgi:hypothetical protein
MDNQNNNPQPGDIARRDLAGLSVVARARRYRRVSRAASVDVKPTSRSRLLTELATPHSFVPKRVPIPEC